MSIKKWASRIASQEAKKERLAAKQKKQKEKRMKVYRKYGQRTLRHSTMGLRSLLYFGVSLAILLACIGISFAMHGEAFGIIGGFGILAGVCAALGVYAAYKGTKERDRNYITCKIGLGTNILQLIGLSIIFIGGF